MPSADLLTRLRAETQDRPGGNMARGEKGKLVFCDSYVHESRILSELPTGRIDPYKTDNGAFAIRNSA